MRVGGYDRDTVWTAVVLILTMVVLVEFMAGCATRGFVRAGATPLQFHEELSACEREVTPRWTFCVGYGPCLDQQAAIRRARNRCMAARGWTLSRAPGAFRP